MLEFLIYIRRLACCMELPNTGIAGLVAWKTGSGILSRNLGPGEIFCLSLPLYYGSYWMGKPRSPVHAAFWFVEKLSKKSEALKNPSAVCMKTRYFMQRFVCWQL